MGKMSGKIGETKLFFPESNKLLDDLGQVTEYFQASEPRAK